VQSEAGQRSAQTARDLAVRHRRGSRRALRVRALAAVQAAFAAGALGACGSSSPTLSTEHVQRTIAAAILAQRAIHATVTCPLRVSRTVGTRFACVAHLQVGSYPLAATVTSASGQVRYGSAAPLVIIDIARVRAAIARSVAAQRHLHVTVRCPAEVLQQAGVKFTCAATASGRSYPFEVVQTDGRGHVRYVGR
jgi:hypothetical protein